MEKITERSMINVLFYFYVQDSYNKRVVLRPRFTYNIDVFSEFTRKGVATSADSGLFRDQKSIIIIFPNLQPTTPLTNQKPSCSRQPISVSRLMRPSFFAEQSRCQCQWWLFSKAKGHNTDGGGNTSRRL